MCSGTGEHKAGIERPRPDAKLCVCKVPNVIANKDRESFLHGSTIQMNKSTVG